jgi:hypothetical protein
MNDNPYDILNVSPLADDREIAKAFAMAMKQRKYPPDEIAKARKSLMNPDERQIADYLRPCLPTVERYRHPKMPEIDRDEAIEIEFLPEFDDLQRFLTPPADAESPSAIDLELGNILFGD